VTRILVAAPGGHLSELMALVERLPLEDQVWVTSDTPMTRDVLARQRVLWVPYVHTRELAKATGILPLAFREVRRLRPTAVISTGAGTALPWMLAAATHGVPFHFVDSATRITDHSTSGRIAAAMPGVHAYTQYADMASGRWSYGGSIFDGYSTEPDEMGDRLPRRILVTLGQSEWGFRRLIERLCAVLPAYVDVTWQTGTTDVAGLPLTSRALIPAEELAEHARAADVIVAHAGVGAAFTALRAGACPVLVPRRAGRGEHVDDHQSQLASDLERRGLAVTADAGELTLDHLRAALARRVVRVEPPPFRFVSRVPQRFETVS
jgi:UDP-N-acetylglucosamine transferase subunit ALG13